MTVFISEEGHIFQAVESGSPDRHIIYDGRLERPAGSDTQCTFLKGNWAIQLVDSWLNSTSLCRELHCRQPKVSMSGGRLHDSSRFMIRLKFLTRLNHSKMASVSQSLRKTSIRKWQRPPEKVGELYKIDEIITPSKNYWCYTELSISYTSL